MNVIQKQVYYLNWVTFNQNQLVRYYRQANKLNNQEKKTRDIWVKSRLINDLSTLRILKLILDRMKFDLVQMVLQEILLMLYFLPKSDQVNITKRTGNK
ncbi:hypothetical protein pb186bvf_007247 [Paramecium bursaria]